MASYEYDETGNMISATSKYEIAKNVTEYSGTFEYDDGKLIGKNLSKTYNNNTTETHADYQWKRVFATTEDYCEKAGYIVSPVDMEDLDMTYVGTGLFADQDDIVKQAIREFSIVPKVFDLEEPAPPLENAMPVESDEAEEPPIQSIEDEASTHTVIAKTFTYMNGETTPPC